MCNCGGPLNLVDDFNFKPYISNDRVIILFTHDKCKAGKPVLKSFKKLAETHPEFFMGRYNLSISVEQAVVYKVYATPTLILFTHGVLTDRVTGFRSEEELLELLLTWQRTTKDNTNGSSS